MAVDQSRLDAISPSENLQALQRVPNELWFKILGQIPRNDLANVTLTTRSLLSVSRTLQFEVFTYHPCDTDYSNQRFTQSDDDVKAAILRLEFWASAEIAPLVRQINISPRQADADEHHQISTDPDRDNLVRDTLVNAFFQHLHHFAHLRKLDCFLLDFTESALQHLCELPFLKALVIERCSISASVAPSASFRLASLEYSDALASYDRLAANGAQRWLTFLEPSCLQSLRLAPARVATVFFRDIGAVGIMSSLHTLDIGLLVTPFRQITEILNRTPALRTLRLSRLGVSDYQYSSQTEKLPSPSSSPVPLLVEYRGPYELLHLVRPGRGLRSLELYGFDGRDCSKAGALLESLRPFQDTMKLVECLDVSLRDVSEATFSAFCSMFSGVKSLHILVSDNDGSDLRETYFNINAQTPNDETTVYVESGFIKSKILAEFSALRYLWLQCGRRLEIVWLRPENGPEILEEREGSLDYKLRSKLQQMFEESSNDIITLSVLSSFLKEYGSEFI